MQKLIGSMKKVMLVGTAAVVLSAVAAPAAMAQNDTFGLTPVRDNIALGSQDLRVTVAGIINVAMSLLGIIAVVIILLGGFKWMTAGGNDDKVQEARKLIFSGIIGLAIILSAWAITQFVISQLAVATGQGGAVPADLQNP